MFLLRSVGGRFCQIEFLFPFVLCLCVVRWWTCTGARTQRTGTVQISSDSGWNSWRNVWRPPRDHVLLWVLQQVHTGLGSKCNGGHLTVGMLSHVCPENHTASLWCGIKAGWFPGGWLLRSNSCVKRAYKSEIEFFLPTSHFTSRCMVAFEKCHWKVISFWSFYSVDSG